MTFLVIYVQPLSTQADKVEECLPSSSLWLKAMGSLKSLSLEDHTAVSQPLEEEVEESHVLEGTWLFSPLCSALVLLNSCLAGHVAMLTRQREFVDSRSCVLSWFWSLTVQSSLQTTVRYFFVAALNWKESWIPHDNYLMTVTNCPLNRSYHLSLSRKPLNLESPVQQKWAWLCGWAS